MLLDKIWQKGKEFLGVSYPIICGGMTWISNYSLVKAVSDQGAFPVLAAGNMPAEVFSAELDKVIANLSHPFAVNLITIAPNYKLHYEIVKAAKVPMVIFAGNFPKREDIAGMKQAGKRTVAFASEHSIARRQIEMGIDALILEGSEAGGHIGHVSLIVLLQQVLFKFRGFPIFTAGGLATGKIMAHLLLMGAYGCQFGTRFVLSEECTAHPEFKKRFMRARSREAISTPQYDSKLPVVAVRALKNKAMDNFGMLQLKLLQQLQSGQISRIQAQYEVEHFWVGSLRRAVEDGDVDNGSLMAGQSVGIIDDIKPIKAIITELIAEAEAELHYIKKQVTV
jgi:enoyl-[acyl-carrier protein] reductase II